jgi:hypothetical protein
MEVEKIDVRLDGLSDIMFDRFINHDKESRPPEQKFYLDGENRVVLPADNVMFFMFGEHPAGTAKWVEGTKGKKFIQVGLSHVFVDPLVLPFTKKENPVFFDKFDNENFAVYWAAGRTKQGSLSIKQELKPRPILKLPWSLNFTLTVIKNALIDETKLYNWFVIGGMQIGLGTYRPRFGRFEVGRWEKT